MKKKGMIFALAFALLGSGLFASTTVFADENGNGVHMQGLVQKISEKFGLSQDEVQTVFDEYRDEMHSEMEQKQEERLDELVESGTITEEQKQLILDKREELREKREAFKSSGAENDRGQMKAQMDSDRQELEAWADANGIDVSYLMGGFGKKSHHGQGEI